MNFYEDLQPLDYADGGEILLPADSSRSYPVLYMFHGLGGIGDWMNIGSGNIRNRMEDLTSTGKINPMVLVMPIIRTEGVSFFPYQRYDVQGLIQYINQTYSDIVKPERKNTGVLGVSMGATAALFYAIKYSDCFYHMGALGPSTMTKNVIQKKSFKLSNESGAVRFVGYGTEEGDDLWPADLYVIESFKENDVTIIFEQIGGTKHDFKTFGPLLDNFLSMIFRS